MIKLIVSDLDDTLIHKDDHLPEAIVDLAKTLKSSGVDFTFATGRMPYRAINFANDIGLTVPFVANNGSILYCNGEMVYAKKLYAGLLKDIIERYMQENPEFTVLFSYEDRERPLKVTQWIRDRFYKYPGYSEPLGCGNDVWNQDVHKVYVVDEQRTGSIGRLARELKSMTDVVSCYQYGEFSVEIVADNIPEGYSLTLIDGALEVVMNQGDVYTTDIAEGENADRFKLLITKNNVSIADVAEAESIRVVNNNRTISIYGGNDVRTEVYNALGQKVYETSDRVFDLNNVASGAYILKVSDGKTVNSAKIVVE